MPVNQNLFYPIIERRDAYKRTNQGKFYSDYREYYNEIETDCQKCCVYCDVSLDEIGGEGMQLDHFRPKTIPEFESLSNDPNNLLLSCPKCNRLKSNHWPADVSADTTCDGDCGFIDPFKENRKDYFEIENTGGIRDKKSPSKYMIQLLKLDRIARRQVRRKRILRAEIEWITDKLSAKIDEIKGMADAGSSRSDISKQITILADLHAMEKQLVEML